MTAVVKNSGDGESLKHQYSEPWDDSDAVLIVENHKLHVHTNILGFASPVFKAMFSSDLKEGMEKVVNLPGKKLKDVLELLNLIYPIRYAITESSDCQEILKLAREYNIGRIKLIADDFLNYKVPCSMKRLIMADEFGLKLTREKHVKYYINTDNDLGNKVFTDDWKMVNPETKLQILGGKLKISIEPIKCHNCFHYNKYCNCGVNSNILITGKRTQTLRDICSMVMHVDGGIQK